MTTVLLIIHSLVAVALLGAITHQTLSTSRGGLPVRFVLPPLPHRAIRLICQRNCRSLCALRAARRDRVQFYFRVDIRPDLEHAGRWQALSLLDLKEHFVSIGFALLPAYWVLWRQPHPENLARTRAALTSILAVIVWFSFLIGHVLNNIMGFES